MEASSYRKTPWMRSSSCTSVSAATACPGSAAARRSPRRPAARHRRYLRGSDPQPQESVLQDAGRRQRRATCWLATRRAIFDPNMVELFKHTVTGDSLKARLLGEPAPGPDRGHGPGREHRARAAHDGARLRGPCCPFGRSGAEAGPKDGGIEVVVSENHLGSPCEGSARYGRRGSRSPRSRCSPCAPCSGCRGWCLVGWSPAGAPPAPRARTRNGSAIRSRGGPVTIKGFWNSSPILRQNSPSPSTRSASTRNCSLSCLFMRPPSPIFDKIRSRASFSGG